MRRCDSGRKTLEYASGTEGELSLSFRYASSECRKVSLSLSQRVVVVVVIVVIVVMTMEGRSSQRNARLQTFLRPIAVLCALGLNRAARRDCPRPFVLCIR